MLRLTIATIWGRRTRFVLSAMAVALGVAFMSGTLVLTDTMGRALDGIAVTAAEGTDAFVRSDRSVTDPETGTVERGTVDDATLATVRATPGVAVAEVRVEGVAQLLARDGRLLDDNPNRATPLGLAWQDDVRLSPLALVDGRAPAADDEIVIDRTSARSGDLVPGDTATVVTGTGPATYRVSGIATYGGVDDAGGAPVIAFTASTAALVLGTPGRYDGIQVAATTGVDQEELVAGLRTSLAATGQVEVLTGDQLVEEARSAAREGLAFITTFFLVFALVALLVGSFVIANTFSITVAQRSRDHALLRAIGASRRQVLGAVLGESAATGLVASAIGVVLGIGTAAGLRALLSGIGVDLPAGPTVVTTQTLLISTAVGTTVAVAAAYLPARRASRVAPLAALRDLGADHGSDLLRRSVVGVASTTLGAGLIAVGLAGAGFAAVGGGATVVFCGVALLGPAIVRPAARLLGAPLGMLGVAGDLARENAGRNTRRTAATASALMIGVGLVAFMTVLASSAKTSVDHSVDRVALGDWVVSTQFAQGGLDADVAEAIDDLPETAAVTGLRYAPATVEGEPATVLGFDPAVINQVVDLDLQAGDLGALDDRSLAVNADVAADHGWEVGDTITVEFPETGPQALTVAALYGTGEPIGSYALSLGGYEANVADRVDTFVLVADTPGVPSAQVRAGIEGVLVGYPTAELLTNDDYKAGIGAEIDQPVAVVYVLLLLAVVIALFGIANTLALSIHERTRELGLLRALGMSRRQVRTTVRAESVIIAVLGTGLGLGIGVGFGWALTGTLADEGLDRLAIPPAQLAVVAVAGAVVGVLAAVNPSRRAARIDILSALQAT